MIRFYDICSQVHIWAGVIALFVGPIQFMQIIRLKRIQFHHLCGRVYVASVAVSSPLALLVSFHSSIWLAVIGTASQSILWFVTTFQAYRFINIGNIKAHRNSMIMSYALTLSAPVLRLSIMAIEHGMHINYQRHYETIYPTLVWISYLPFFVVFVFLSEFSKGAASKDVN